MQPNLRKNTQRVKYLHYNYVQISPIPNITVSHYQHFIQILQCYKPNVLYFTLLIAQGVFLILLCRLFQRVLELHAAAMEHEMIFMDEVDFNLVKRRESGRNAIGQYVIVKVPGQCGGNITMCATINHHSVIHHYATFGPYNIACLITFLDTLHNILISTEQMVQSSPGMLSSRTTQVSSRLLVCNWFIDNSYFSVNFLPPYSPFLKSD